MATSTVTIRMDDVVTSEFDQLMKRLGLSMSDAFEIFARAAIREGGFPFDIKIHSDLEYAAHVNVKLMKCLEMLDDPNTRLYTLDELKAAFGDQP